MNKTIWAFGCSFTEGFWQTGFNRVTQKVEDRIRRVRYTLDEEEIPFSDTFQYYSHFEVLKRLLNENTPDTYSVKNYGLGGSCRRTMLYTYLQHLHEIKEEDIVIFGHTLPNRQAYYFEEVSRDGVSRVSTASITHSTLDAYKKGYVDTSIPKGSLLLPSLRWLKGRSKEYCDTLMDFYLNIASGRGNQLELENKILDEIFNSITLSSKLRGIKVFSWSAELWRITYPSKAKLSFTKAKYYFENSYNWSNKRVEDHHWSPNGEYKAGLFFYWCIENGIRDFNSKYIPEFDKTNPDSKFDYLDFESFIKK